MCARANHLALIRSFLFDSASRALPERQFVQKYYCSAQQRKSFADRREIRAAGRNFCVATRNRAHLSRIQLDLISSLFLIIRKFESRSRFCLRTGARRALSR
jgi:hypothetical protein